MSHMPRRLRRPHAVTVLIWKGPGNLRPCDVRMAKRQYLRAAMTGTIVAGGDWDVREVSRRFGGIA